MLEKTLESPLDSKEIKPIIKEISSEYSLEGLMLKLKLKYFGHLMGRANSLLAQRQRKKRVVEDEIVRQYHQLNGYELEQTLGDSKGQRSLACCSPWGCEELDRLSD